MKSQDTMATLRGMEQFGALARWREDLAVRGGRPGARGDRLCNPTTLRLLTGIALCCRPP